MSVPKLLVVGGNGFLGQLSQCLLMQLLTVRFGDLQSGSCKRLGGVEYEVSPSVQTYPFMIVGSGPTSD